MKKYYYDAAVCAAVIITAALLIAFPAVFKTTDNSKLYAEISVNGKTEETVPLYKDCVYVCSNGVTVSIENGSARISASDCKDKLCMHNSKLNKSGDTAVCLPNKTVVSICGSTPREEVDGIVG